MAISRVEGPMLLTNLDRQGVDLSFTTNPGAGTQTLVYMDFTNFKLGVNTATMTEVLTVNGNVVVNNRIKSPSGTNANIYIIPDGSGNVTITNANICSGSINGTTIGTTTTANAFFSYSNVTSKFTAGLIQATNIGANSIPISNGAAFFGDPKLQWFSANSTLFANTLITGGTVGYTNLNITGQFTYNTGTYNYVPFFAANNLMIVSPGFQYFTGNSTLRANTVSVPGLAIGGVPYLTTGNTLATATGLIYDGTNFSVPTGTTTISKLQFGATAEGQTISTTVLDVPLYLRPQGLGTVDVSGFRITTLADPVNNTDAATKEYVDARTVGIGANVITQGTSKVSVFDQANDPNSGLPTANVTIAVNGGIVAQFLPYAPATSPSLTGYSYFGTWQVYNNTLQTTYGDATIIPAGTGKITLQATTAVSLPTGATGQRPVLPAVGDFRFNNELGTVEWYNGASWTPGASTTTTASQVFTPDGVSKIYTLSQNASSSSVLVILNGVIQQADVAYTVTGGTTLTFLAEAPLTSDIVEIRYLASNMIYSSSPTFINTSFSNIATAPGGGTTVDSFYTTQYVASSYQFVIKNTTTGQYQMGTAYLIQNGITANVQITTQTTIGAANTLISWSATDSLGYVTLKATATLANTYVKLSRTYFNQL